MKLLIRDIEELKVHYPVQHTDHGFRRIVPFIEAAQDMYLLEVMGEETLNALLDHHEQTSESGSGSSSGSGEPTTNACMAKLLPYAQRACAFLAMYEGFNSLEINIGLEGITALGTDSEKTAANNGQTFRARKDTLKLGMNAVERMLVFMEANKDCYTDWAESDARTDMLGHIIPTAKMFTQYYGSIANKRLTYMALRPRMTDVEETVVRDTLGDALYEQLMAQLPDQVSAKNSALLTHLRPLVAKLTVSRAMPGMMLQIEGYGVYTALVEKNERNAEVKALAPGHVLYEERETLKNEAEGHRKDLIDLLNAKVADYPLFKTSTHYVEPSTDSGKECGPISTGGVRGFF